MNPSLLLESELHGSITFFLEYTNLDPQSPGFGLTVDSTKKPNVASIAATGFALTAWVIATERGWLSREQARQITRLTLDTLHKRVPHIHGFFAHFLDIYTANRFHKCEFSTIDTALCLNGVITAANYFQEDSEISELAACLLERVDWEWLVFEREDQALFHMSYNPDPDGDYVQNKPGFIGCWDMAAEQKMMYLQAAPHLATNLARRLYAGFRRERGEFAGQSVIFSPEGSLFTYLFSEAWLDVARFLDPDGINWFENTRCAARAHRAFCIANAERYKTYGENSWGLSAGDSPHGYDVFGAPPCRGEPHHDGTISIYAAIACLPFLPDESLALIDHLYREHPQCWGKYGFFDAYNLDVSPAWYSQDIYAIDKGVSMILLENYLTRLIWEVYTNSPYLRRALEILAFKEIGLLQSDRK